MTVKRRRKLFLEGKVTDDEERRAAKRAILISLNAQIRLLIAERISGQAIAPIRYA